MRQVIGTYIKMYPRDPVQPLVVQESGFMTQLNSLDIPELGPLYERIFRKATFMHPPLLERLGHLGHAARRFAEHPEHTLAHRGPADARQHAQALALLSQLRGRGGSDPSMAARRMHTLIPRISIGSPDVYDLGARLLYLMGQGAQSGADPQAVLKLFEQIVQRYDDASCAVFFQAFQRSLIEPIERELPPCLHDDYVVRDAECVITYDNASHQERAFTALAAKFGNDPYKLFDIAATIEPWTIDYFFHREYGERFFVRPHALHAFMSLAPRLRGDLMRKRLFDRQIRRFIKFERFASPLARRHQLDLVRDAAATLMIFNREYFTGPHGTINQGHPLPAAVEAPKHPYHEVPRHWLRLRMLTVSTAGEPGFASMQSALSFFRHSIKTA